MYTLFFDTVLCGDTPGDRLRDALLRNHKDVPCFLRDAAHIPAGPLPYHNGSVLDHLARCMNAVAGDPLAVWMALVHDAGKLTTPKDLWPHHYGHEIRGAVLAAVWATFLKLPETYRQCGCLAARLHMKAGRYTQLRPGTKYDLLLEVEKSPCAASFWKLVDADTRSRISLQARSDWKDIQRIAEKQLSDDQMRQACSRFLSERKDTRYPAES